MVIAIVSVSKRIARKASTESMGSMYESQEGDPEPAPNDTITDHGTITGGDDV